jgi:hypothetical protein
MNTQPEALRLADILQHKIPTILCLERAAAEMRRLHEVNQELVKVLKKFSDFVHSEEASTDGEVVYCASSITHLAFSARDALAKATGERK